METTQLLRNSLGNNETEMELMLANTSYLPESS